MVGELGWGGGGGEGRGASVFSENTVTSLQQGQFRALRQLLLVYNKANLGLLDYCMAKKGKAINFLLTRVERLQGSL